MSAYPLLRVQDLSLSIEKRKVLDCVSFDLVAGQSLAIVGPNAAGKSTLLKTIAGISSLADSQDNRGAIFFDGEDLMAMPAPERAKRVVYLPSDLRAEFPVSVWEMVSLGRLTVQSGWWPRFSEEDERKLKTVLQQCRCLHLKDRLLSEISDGERQLVVLARALFQGGRVLLLDESMSKLDLGHRLLLRKIMDEFRASGGAWILVSHDLNFVQSASEQCLFIKSGKILLRGPTEEILNFSNLLQFYPEMMDQK